MRPRTSRNRPACVGPRPPAQRAVDPHLQLLDVGGGNAEAELWLDWSSLPAALGTEEKLSHLARWVIDAHESGLSFGLRLPGKTVEMENGDAQRERCLEALALFEAPGTTTEP